MGLGDEGLPLSLQIAAPLGSDRFLLQAAELIEEVLEWPSQYPDPSNVEAAPVDQADRSMPNEDREPLP